MNILRTIKINHLSGELDNIPEKEKFILSHFDGLHIIKRGNFDCFVNDKGDYYFNYDIINKSFAISGKHVWRPIQRKYHMSDGIMIYTFDFIFKYRLKIKTNYTIHKSGIAQLTIIQ